MASTYAVKTFATGCRVTMILAALSAVVSRTSDAQSLATVAMRPVQYLDLVDVGEVQSIAVQADGGIVVAGNFTRMAGQPRLYLARIAPNGLLDEQWLSDVSWGSALDRPRVTALAGGAVLLSGGDARIGALSRGVVRLRSDGTYDAQWVGPNYCGYASEWVPAADGWLYYYDSCTSALRRVAPDASGAVDANWSVSLGVVDRLAGAEDALFAYTRSGTLIKVDVAAAAVDTQWQPGYSGAAVTDLVVGGGAVYAANGSGQVFKYSSTGAGAADPIWPTSLDVPDHSSSLALDGAGSLFVGGSDDDRNGTVLARLSTTNGQVVDSRASIGMTTVGALGCTGAGRVVVGGSFSNIGGAARLGFALFDGAAIDAAVDAERAAVVTHVAAQPDGALIVAGLFARALGFERRQILRLTKDGSLDTAWNPHVAGEVADVLVDAGGSVFVSGTFLSIGGVSRPYLAKLHGNGNGELDTTWNPPADRASPALAADDAGWLYVAGPTVTQMYQIARTSRSGDGSFDVNWHANAFVLYESDIVVVGGHVYAQHSGGSLRRFSAESGALDANWQVAVNDDIRRIEPGAGQSLIIHGDFATVDGLPRRSVARVLTDRMPAVDAQWNAQIPPTYGQRNTASTSAAGDVFVMGGFDSVAGQPRPGTAKVDGTSGTLLEWIAPIGGRLSAIGGDQIWTVRREVAEQRIDILRYPLERGDVILRSRWELD